MKATSIQLTPVGYVHNQTYSRDCDTWTSWIKVKSERHANRLIPLLNWYERVCPGPGQFYRSVWYDEKNKRLVTSAGYDV
jgi:hypothetical protein